MNRLTALATTAVLALAPLAAPGCQAVDRSPPAGLGDEWPPPGNDPQIAVLNPELIEWIRFHPAIVTGGEDVPLAVEVPARNTAPRQYLLDYRMLFYDAEGRELEPVMGWQMIALEPKQIVRMKAKALDTRAQYAKLEVKWSR